VFTGLIQDVGTVRQTTRLGLDMSLTIEAGFRDFIRGESISVSGACLTVTDFASDRFTVFASKETVEKTGVLELRNGSRVNLERALKIGDPIGGHLVSGHVDTRVSLVSRKSMGSAEEFTFALPKGELASQIASKGSAAIDGVSLTVNEVGPEYFQIMIIPITLQDTTLGALRPGDRINLETDVIAKYIARQLKGREGGGVDMSLLERAGFIR
jgi:riboflavin synthase